MGHNKMKFAKSLSKHYSLLHSKMNTTLIEKKFLENQQFVSYGNQCFYIITFFFNMKWLKNVSAGMKHWTLDVFAERWCMHESLYSITTIMCRLYCSQLLPAKTSATKSNTLSSHCLLLFLLKLYKERKVVWHGNFVW